MKRLIIVLALPVFLFACGVMEPKMSTVMGNCDGQNFANYVECIKTNYKRAPNDRDVKAFYAHLDAISEDLRLGKISETRAKSLAYTAYNETVEAGNRAEAAQRSQAYTNQQINQIRACQMYGWYC